MKGAGPLPRKIVFVPKMMFGFILSFDAVFNRQKTLTVTIEAFFCDTDFTVQYRNEAYRNSAKVIHKLTHFLPPPEYATAAHDN